jgi:hypothetical protein
MDITAILDRVDYVGHPDLYGRAQAEYRQRTLSKPEVNYTYLIYNYLWCWHFFSAL